MGILHTMNRGRAGTWPMSALPLALLLLMLTIPSFVAASVLKNVDYSLASGSEVRIVLELSEPIPAPNAFAIDNPSRIVVDLPDTSVGLSQKFLPLDLGRARSLRAVEGEGRTRIVIGLTQLVPYTVTADGSRVVVNLDGGAVAPRAESSRAEEPAAVSRAPDRSVVGIPAAASGGGASGGNAIEDIDFRRGPGGEARITVRLGRPDIVVDLQERGNRIQVDFLNTRLTERLLRRLDVTDFATPVSTIDAMNVDSLARLTVTPSGAYEHLAYQAGNLYTLEVKPVTADKDETIGERERKYSGERLSFNFQNIEVRAVLQLIADFTGLNVVASDTVGGNITLRLKNVPWDQALDIILKARGLGMRQVGNVLLVAPNEEIAARDEQELKAKKQLQQLVPLRTEFFAVNYAKADDIKLLISGDEKGTSFLSERGTVTVDPRTNTLMVKDIGDRLEDIAKLIQRLDIPIRQVLIESRIVVANDDFSRTLGVRAGVTGVAANGANGVVTTSGSATGTSTMVSSAVSNLGSNGTPYPIGLPELNDRLNVDLPASGTGIGSLALAILGSDYLVDLELSALQNEGKGEVVSNPRVITSNQKTATIEQGVEIPYQEASASGATSVSFKKAVLSLKVTPQITPDDRVIMDLEVSKDARGEETTAGPAIDTRAVQTQVLVDNGSTVVLGGIYEQTRRNDLVKVPLLGDLPILGALFRQTIKRDNKAELLIFVTPKIIKDNLTRQVGGP